jgi:hypothetical protein
MSTVAQILHLDKKYKNEFKKLNGYLLIEKIFFDDRNFDDENQNQFVDSFFELLELMIINNDSENSIIVNQDAFKMLISLLDNSYNYDILDKALQQIER